MKFKSIYQLMIQIKSVYGGAAGVKKKQNNNSTPIHIRSTVRKSIPNHILDLYKKKQKKPTYICYTFPC